MRADAKLGVLIVACVVGVACWYYWDQDRPDRAIDFGPLESVDAAAEGASPMAGEPGIERLEPVSRAEPVVVADGVAEPVVRPVVVPEPAKSEARQHTIGAGDSLALLAERYYGNQAKQYVDLIVQANPGVNPHRLKIGTRVAIPPLPERATPAVEAVATAEAPALASMYRVQSGDSFYLIAKRLCGDGTRWRALYSLNKDRVAGGPGGLKPGQILRVPGEWSASRR